jgi:hypothetical protein
MLAGPRLVLAAVMLLIGTAAAYAVDNGQIRLGADYDIFVIGGEDFRSCQEACEDDVRCKAWTFLKTIGQCRLKHTAVPAFPNNCCVSGLKEDRTPPRIADEGTCADFAVAALDDNDANRANQCGYTGPSWSSNYREIFGRCLESSPKRRQAEADERREALDDCTRLAKRSQQVTCDHYARMSVEQQKSNVANRCGYRGPDWSDDPKVFIDECRGTLRSQIDDRILAREAKLERCFETGGELDPACEKYGKMSVIQFNRARQMRCGPAYSNAMWHADFRKHYDWCLKASAPDRQKWLVGRNKGLRECEDDRRRGGKIILKF